MRVPRREAPHRRSSWAGIAGYVALSVGCMVAGAVTFLLIAAPVDFVRDRAVELVKARTGRDLVIAGPTKLTYFPRFGVAFSQVSLGAPADMGGPPLLAARTLRVELPVWSLLSRRVALQQVRLDAPVIELHVDAQGRRSWDFAAWQDRPIRLAQAGGRTNDAGLEPRQQSGRGGLLPASSVRILDATVRYIDERSGTSQELTGLDADLAADDASNTLDAKGSVTWSGEKLGFEARLASADTSLGRGPASLSLRISGRPFEATYDGSVGLGRELEADGTVNIRAASWAELAQRLGRHGGAGVETGALAVSARVAAANRRVALDDLSATLGDSSLTGSLSVETGGARPHVSGRLQLSELDFGRLLLRPGRPEPGAGATADPIGDLLQSKSAAPDKAPEGRGPIKRSAVKDWSDEIIDLAPLGLADADLALSVDRLVYKNVATGRSRLALALQDRVAKITLEDVQLYAGRARGMLTLDGQGQVAATTVNLALDGVSTLPLLSDTLDFGWLDGHGAIAVALAGQGNSERQIVEALRGKVQLSVTDGAIVGLDIGRLLGGIEKGRFSGLRTNPEDRTPFSEFGGSFVIANGIAQNQDLRLVSPHLHVSGSGSANLALRQVDYIVRPKVAASHTGDGSVVSLAGLEVPVQLEGPWDKPTFTPDLKGVLGSEQAGEAIKQIGKNLKSQEVQDAIRGLLGGGDGQQKVKPRELLEKLLKKD